MMIDHMGGERDARDGERGNAIGTYQGGGKQDGSHSVSLLVDRSICRDTLRSATIARLARSRSTPSPSFVRCARSAWSFCLSHSARSTTSPRLRVGLVREPRSRLLRLISSTPSRPPAR